MKPWVLSIVVTAPIVGAAIISLAMQNTPPRGAASDELRWRQLEGTIGELRDSIRHLAERIDRQPPRSEERGTGAPEPAPAVTREDQPAMQAEIATRLDGIDAAIASLAESVAGLRAPPLEFPDFTTEDGFVHADGLFDAGRYMSAANGYLSFLREHPNHPDALDFWKKARAAFWKGGAHSQAIATHEEILQLFPEAGGYSGMLELARMEKDAGRLDDARRHAFEAAELATTPGERAVGLSYGAWYVHLAEGDAAGLEAYRATLAEYDTMGVSDGKQATKLRERVAEIESRLAAR